MLTSVINIIRIQLILKTSKFKSVTYNRIVIFYVFYNTERPVWGICVLSQVFGIGVEVWTEDLLQRERVQIYFNDVIFIEVEKTRPILFLFKIKFITFLDPASALVKLYEAVRYNSTIFFICLLLVSELCLTLKTKAISVLWHGYQYWIEITLDSRQYAGL